MENHKYSLSQQDQNRQRPLRLERENMCQDSFKGSALLSPSRNVGLGTSSAAGRVGSITSPFVIWLVCKRMIISYTQTSQQQLVSIF